MTGPLFLMAVTPVFAMVMVHVSKNLGGDWSQFWAIASARSGSGGSGSVVGVGRFLFEIWPSWRDPTALKLIFSFFAFEAFLTKAVPGDRFEATITAAGNVPVYKANGLSCYFITLVALLVGTNYGLVNPSLVYDKFPEIISSLNAISLALCFWLLVKGDRTTDSGSNGSVVVDYYWGVDLYPKLWGFDVKQMTNCRFGMMYWAVGILCYAHKNMEINGGVVQSGMAVNVVLQLIYIAKFFHWEMGYMCSMDIQHDRAGYYLCWGCLVWVPSVYTSHSFYLAENCPDVSPPLAAGILLLGFLAIFLNYDSDNQRYVFRQTKGECTIWGRRPTYIVASYLSGGRKRTNLLLTSGVWGMSRHFHYLPELTAAFMWSSPG